MSQTLAQIKRELENVQVLITQFVPEKLSSEEANELSDKLAVASKALDEIRKHPRIKSFSTKPYVYRLRAEFSKVRRRIDNLQIHFSEPRKSENTKKVFSVT